MRGSAFKRITAMVLLVVLTLIVFTPFEAIASDEQKIIRVGWSEDGGEDEDGPQGYEYEYLQALSQFTGWEYEFVEGTWAECLERVKNGEIDILGYVQKTDEREKIYGYCDYPMATTNGYLVTDESSGLTEQNIKDHEFKVGLVSGNAYNEMFKEYAENSNISVQYVNLNCLADVSVELEMGNIDAAIVSDEDLLDSMCIVEKIATSNQYYISDIDNTEVLAELNHAMSELAAYYPSFNNDLYQKYFGTKSGSKPIFTSAELEFIENNPNILVMYDSGWPPIEYFDEETGTYKGISPDIFSLITEKCGIEFVYEGLTSGEILDQINTDSNINTLTTISYDYEWADRHDVYITQPFITSSIVKLGYNLYSEDATVAINEKAYFTYALSDELEGMTTKNYSKQSDRIEAIRNGEADYTYVTEDQANYYRSIPKYSDMQVGQLVDREQKICIAIPKGSDPELMSIISKSLACISHDDMTKIIQDNTVNLYKLTTLDYIYKYRIMIVVLAALVIVIMASIVMVSSVRKSSLEKITEAYEKAEAALEIAEKASTAKGSFMSHMSHEIRTPLNAVIGYNKIAENELAEAATEEERKIAEMKAIDCLTKSEIASKHLLTIINDVLDMSAIENGRIKVAHEKFDFKGLVNSITTVFYSQTRAKGVDFEVSFDNATPEWLIGDQMRTNQILTNLISNAVKFTATEGLVKVNIREVESDDKSSLIEFKVVDSGIGMSDEYLTHLWTPFEQENSSISRRFGGSGLGLSITKNLVKLMDGTIDVQSKQGVGTTFIVQLRFEKTEQLDCNNSYDFSGMNALVVDDDESTCEYIRLLFNRVGTRCATVTSGTDAIEIYKRAIKKNDPFNLCLIDWHMPKMDGLETIKRIKKISNTDIPVIVITAYDYSEMADKAAEMGISLFLSKPLFQSSLFNILADITEHKTRKKVVVDKKYSFTDTEVILAEDNNMNMEIADRLLTSVGIKVQQAWDGREAVKYFLESKSGTYKAILMDVRMPIMDGYEATRIIRESSHPEAKTIPIIAMTADAFAENIAEAIEAGMDAHISKPINTAVLFSTLKDILRK